MLALEVINTFIDRISQSHRIENHRTCMSFSFYCSLKEIKKSTTMQSLLLVWSILAFFFAKQRSQSTPLRIVEITLNSLLSFVPIMQVSPRRLSHRRLHKRLPGRLLPALWGLGAWGEDRALCPLHGELRWLQHLWWHSEGFQALGVQQATLSQRATQVLWKVPALHALLPGVWVPAGSRVLLYM